MKIEMISVEDLVPSEWNPSTRTDSRAIKDLVSSMEEDGFWKTNPIILASNGNSIVDGHRRWTAAKIAGILRVPCVRTEEKDPQVAWAKLNAFSRPIKSRDIIQAYGEGFEELSFSPAGRRIQRYINKYGKDLVVYCAENNVSITPIMYAERVAVYIGWSEKRVPEIVRWIIKYKLVRQIWFAIHEKQIDRDRLRKKIEGDLDLYD